LHRNLGDSHDKTATRHTAKAEELSTNLKENDTIFRDISHLRFEVLQQMAVA
jgi:hypothetical protein